MTSLPRGFVAVYPPPTVVAALERKLAAVRDAAPQLRWTRAEQWHLTLRFLGAVPDVEGLADALGRAVAPVAPIPAVELRTGGAFPRARHASVLWVGVADGDALLALAGAVEAAATAAGFPPEERPFHPHLTVARAGRPRDLRPLVDAIGDRPIGEPWPVADVVLVASDTRADGASYSEVARFPLAG